MSRNSRLDVLRAVAVLLVLGNHLTWQPAQISSIADRLTLYEFLGRFGWTGVDLFFCLSGFLVSGLLFRDFRVSGRIHCKRFLVRRGFKIYPAFYVLLAVTVMCCQLGGSPLPWKNVFADALFVQDYTAGTWGHLWSLGIEEQFYLLLAISFVALCRSRRADPFRSLPWICAVVAASCIILRAVEYRAIPFDHATHIRPFHLRCDALSFGVLLRYLQEFRPELLRRIQYGNRRLLLIASVLCLLPALLLDQGQQFMYVFGLTLLYMGYGGILLYSVSLKNQVPSGEFLALLSRIGRSSYSIYLWHIPVVWVFLRLNLPLTRDLMFGAYMLTSVLFGIGMAHAIEYPALRLRERFFPDRESEGSVRQAEAVSFDSETAPSQSRLSTTAELPGGRYLNRFR